MTIIAVLAILATLLFSGITGARKRSRQSICAGNLRQIAVAVQTYQNEFGRRVRSLTRLAQKETLLTNTNAFICPEDVVQAVRSAEGLTNAAWGNSASPAQDPGIFPKKGDLDEASWELEVIETKEKLPFSYLHALAWRRSAWQRLTDLGKPSGMAVCQLHGVRTDPSRNPGVKLFLTWEGLTLRAQRDGAVVIRRLFRGDSPTSAEGVSIVPWTPDDYPWEYYTDNWSVLYQSATREKP